MTEEQENLSRRERRAKAKGDDGESVKDRNQRMRAAAASRRRAARTQERETAAAMGLDASERVDDALVRGADATGKFVRDNFVWLQWIVVLGVAAAMAILIIDYRRGLSAEKVGQKLALALNAENARVVSSEPAPESSIEDIRPEFPSAEARANSAIKKWQALKGSKTPEIALSAQLSIANELFDQKKYDDALPAYRKVESDPRSGNLKHLRARAVEGTGLVLEARGELAQAKEAFGKLKNFGIEDFVGLSDFHVARIEFLEGHRDKALELLKPLDEKLSKDAGPQGPTDYLGAAVRDLLKTVDPTAAARELAEMRKLQEKEQQERIRKMIEEMQKNAAKGGAPMPEIPGLPPVAAPEDSSAPEPAAASQTEAAADSPQQPSVPTPAPVSAAPAPKAAPPAPKAASAPAPSAAKAASPTAVAPKAPAPAVPQSSSPPTPAAPAPTPAAPPSQNGGPSEDAAKAAE